MTGKHIRFKLSDLIKNGIDKELFTGNWIKIDVDKSLSTEQTDKLLDKLSSLMPLSIHLEYNADQIDASISDYEFTGISITDCIREYVDLLDIDYKSDVTDEVIDLYERVSS